jgi:hypothetical protein
VTESQLCEPPTPLTDHTTLCCCCCCCMTCRSISEKCVTESELCELQTPLTDHTTLLLLLLLLNLQEHW